MLDKKLRDYSTQPFWDINQWALRTEEQKSFTKVNGQIYEDNDKSLCCEGKQ